MRFLRRKLRPVILAVSIGVLAFNSYQIFRAFRTKMSQEQGEDGMVSLLGTTYEGGGGLIRDALSYSDLLNKPVTIHSIRANRPGVGGLRNEHTVAIKTITYLTGATTEGNEIAGQLLKYKPHSDKEAESIQPTLDVTVEGSASIFMIAMLPHILFARLGSASTLEPKIPDNGVELTIRAGTLCIKAPSNFFMQQVFLPTLKLIGIGENNLRLSEDYDQGWHTDYVKSAGRMTIWAKPLTAPIEGFTLQRRGRVNRLRVTAHAPKQHIEHFHRILRQELESSVLEFAKAAGLIIDIDVFPTTIPEQFHILLVAETTAPTAYIGYEQVFPQKSGFPEGLIDDKANLFTHLARVALLGLVHELKSGNAIDENMEDILVVYQAVAHGFSSLTAPENEKLVQESETLRVPFKQPEDKYHLDVKSLHRETAWWVAHEMAGVEFTNKKGRFGADGIGLGTKSGSSLL